MDAYNSIGEDGEEEKLHKAMHTIHEYLDCTRDIMEHRYLAFLFNTGSHHWVTMLVVNPSFTMSNESSATFTHGNIDEQTCGWFFFDSIGNKENYNSGLKGTLGDADDKIIGSVRFFMNVCASFIKAINSPNQSARNYNYVEHFGSHCDTKGTNSFPRFDFDRPAILKQVDGWNCGLACLVNAVAFVRHFQDKEFLLSGMTHVSNGTDEIRYIVNHNEYNLSSFWDKLLRTVSPKNKKTLTITDILTKLRDEFVVLLEDLHSLLPGTPSINELVVIPDKEDMEVIDLTINFPENMTPVKKKKENDKDDNTYDVSDRRKHLYSRKKDVMKSLRPYAVKDQLSDEEYKLFSKLFLSKVWDLQDVYESRCTNNCAKCITSFPDWYDFAIPQMYGYPWQILHHTPETVHALPELKMWFQNSSKKLQHSDKQRLCYWSSQYVELALLLLCHTIHAVDVQCFFLPDTYVSADIIDEQLVHVKEGVKILLCIVYKAEHFAVVKVHLEEQRVSLWDSAIEEESLVCAETHWLSHIIYLIRVHFPKTVRYNKEKNPCNIQTSRGSSKRKNWKNFWKITALRTWLQPNDYICGAIAINRFAFELRAHQATEDVEPELQQLIQSPDTLEDDNFCRAASILEYLLKKKLDGIKIQSFPKMTSEMEEEFKEMDDAVIR